MLLLAGEPILWRVIERVYACRLVSNVLVITGRHLSNQPIINLCVDKGVPWYAGDDDDVLDRFYEAAIAHDIDHVMRITADCPLVDPDVLALVIKEYVLSVTRNTDDLVYVSALTGTPNNQEPLPRYPDGFDAECFNLRTLAQAWRLADSHEREHVTPWMVRQCQRTMRNVWPSQDYGHLRLTVDTQEDYALVSRIYDALYPRNPAFTFADILAFLKVSSHADTVADKRRRSV